MHRLAGLTLVLLLESCGPGGGASPAPPSPAPLTQDPGRRQFEISERILAWLECTECEDGELQAVTVLREEAVPALLYTLRTGPSPKKSLELRQHLETSFDQMASYADRVQDANPPVSEQDFVEAEMGRYQLLYRSRAAVALHAIGTPDALAGLAEVRAGLGGTREPVGLRLLQEIDGLGVPDAGDDGR